MQIKKLFRKSLFINRVIRVLIQEYMNEFTFYTPKMKHKIQNQRKSGSKQGVVRKQ